MAQAAEKLFTLTEVANRTKISMPTLQRYKKLYQDRIPSEGSGRKQRYPQEALAVFLQLKKENIGRRGRPRKNAAPAPAPVAKAKSRAKTTKKRTAKRGKAAEKKPSAAKSNEGLLTLTQVSKLTGVSYPTLLRYVKTNLSDIPHKGSGRARRFKPGAVAVFKSLRQRSKRGRKSKATLAAEASRKVKQTSATKKKGARRGRPPKVVEPADLLARIKDLEKNQTRLERLIAKQQKQLEKPFRVVLQRK